MCRERKTADNGCCSVAVVAAVAVLRLDCYAEGHMIFCTGAVRADSPVELRKLAHQFV